MYIYWEHGNIIIHYLCIYIYPYIDVRILTYIYTYIHTWKMLLETDEESYIKRNN